jgi:hypothetical protein
MPPEATSGDDPRGTDSWALAGKSGADTVLTDLSQAGIAIAITTVGEI